MAFLDDKQWLLSFIRNQFIVSDDTSMCENILGPEISTTDFDGPYGSFLGPSPSLRGNDDELLAARSRGASSPDIVMNMDTRMTRRRSNTTVRLEKIRKEREEKSKIKTTHWKSARNLHGLSSLSEQNLNDIFPESTVGSVNKPRVRSLLSLEVGQNIEREINNGFLEYARFDGKINRGVATKTFKIFFHLMSTAIVLPMKITIISSARFSDLVGFVCWQYGVENRQPPLNPVKECFSLFMAEDNGAIDEDLPKIDLGEFVSRFGDNKLAFVENEQPLDVSSRSPVVVKINLVDGSFSKIVLENYDISLRQILEKVLKKRKMQPVCGLEYTLEKVGEPGALDLDQTLDNAKSLEFWLIRANSKKPSDAPDSTV